MPSLNGNFFFFAVFKKCILIFGLILCWVCGHPRSNSVFLFGFYRRRRCSQFHGSMQLDMAGSWTKTQACSRSGPSTQVSRHAFIYMQTLRTIKKKKHFFFWFDTKQNAFCREIRGRSDVWPKDVESQLPLCNELTAWHRGGKRQER